MIGKTMNKKKKNVIILDKDGTPMIYAPKVTFIRPNDRSFTQRQNLHTQEVVDELNEIFNSMSIIPIEFYSVEDYYDHFYKNYKEEEEDDD